MTFKSKPDFPKLKAPPKTIDGLYPHLKPNEQAEAADTLKRYVALVWRIFKRIQREEKEKFDDNQFKR